MLRYMLLVALLGLVLLSWSTTEAFLLPCGGGPTTRGHRVGVVAQRWGIVESVTDGIKEAMKSKDKVRRMLHV